MTEQEIINGVFYLLEKDSDVWDTADNEYVTARGLLNIGVTRWEHYDNTTWEDLWTTLEDETGGDRTVSASTYEYDCPTNFSRIGGYISTESTDGVLARYRVLKPEEVKKYENTTGNWCFVSGNKSVGYKINFNPSCVLPVSATINYPYYKVATQSSATSTVLEVGDPNFLVYFIASHMSDNSDSGIDGDFFTIAEGLLKQMKSKNNSGVWGNPFQVESDLESLDGFGTGGGNIASSSNPTGR